MNRLRIVLYVFFLTAIFFAFVALYISHRITKNKIDTAVLDLQLTMKGTTRGFNNKCSRISSQTDLISQQLCSGRTDVFPSIKMLMKDNVEIACVSINYSRKFLSEYRKGKYSQYQMVSTSSQKIEKENLPELYSLSIYQRDNRYNVVQNAVVDYDVHDCYVAPLLLNDGLWVDPFTSIISGQICTAYSVPFYPTEDKTGAPAGVLTVVVKMKELIENSIKGDLLDTHYQNVRFFLIDQSAKIIYHSESNPWVRTDLYSILDEIGRVDLFSKIDAMQQNQSGVVVLPNLNAIEYGVQAVCQDTTRFVYSKVSGVMHWNLVAVFNESVFREQAYDIAQGIFFWGVLVSLIFATVLSFILIKENYPIEQLIQIAKMIGTGHFDVKVNDGLTQRKDGIGELSRTFNFMVDHIQGNINKAVTETTRRKLMERELMIAQDIQRSFLPIREHVLPESEYFDLAADLIPAKYVAGDFFDYWRIDDDHIALLIADVSGKGVSAAMVMIESRTLLRQIVTTCSAPDRVLTEMNRIMQETNSACMFITMFLSIYNIRTGVVRFVNAGHNPPILIHKNGQIQWLSMKKFPVIGLIPNVPYEAESFTLDYGDLFFLYTDGVLDAATNENVPYGKTRLVQLLSSLAQDSPSQLLSTVIGDIVNYQGDIQKDDITVVVLKRNPS